MGFRIWLKVPRLQTRSVKVALENESLLAKDVKITPFQNESSLQLIPTCIISESISGPGLEETAQNLFRLLHCAVPEIEWDIDSLSLHRVEPPPDTPAGCNTVQAAMLRASFLLAATRGSDINQHRDLLMRLGKAFCIYPPMLLLSAGKDARIALERLSQDAARHNSTLQAFMESVTQSLGLTHVALNAPVPSSISDNGKASSGISEENCIRSPVHLVPLYGNFGPLLAPFPSHKPCLDDFTGAFWVHARQNGIIQTWAPYYTMFSAGNVTEKARLMTLESVQESIANGIQDGKGCTAVDLFAGIGYFAFSYLKAGVSKMLCWDLNPWSIEGLRRGALANKWTVTVHERLPVDQVSSTDASLLAFRESNECAAARIALLKSTLPPIRHVNCGMLPSSGEAWKTAVDILDPFRGGWIHLHESVRVKSLQSRVESIVNDVETHVTANHEMGTKNVRLDHVEKVKGVGPGLIHIVLDIWIPHNAKQ